MKLWLDIVNPSACRQLRNSDLLVHPKPFLVVGTNRKQCPLEYSKEGQRRSPQLCLLGPTVWLEHFQKVGEGEAEGEIKRAIARAREKRRGSAKGEWSTGADDGSSVIGFGVG